MNLPLSKRFGIRFSKQDEGGWILRVYLVFFCVFFCWNYYDWSVPFRRQTGVILGFLSTRIRQGNIIPCRRWMRYTYGK